jgi:hypothetical protein
VTGRSLATGGDAVSERGRVGRAYLPGCERGPAARSARPAGATAPGPKSTVAPPGPPRQQSDGVEGICVPLRRCCGSSASGTPLLIEDQSRGQPARGSTGSQRRA